MAEITINTTQNVNINFVVADMGSRIGAYFIDQLIKWSYLILLYVLFLRFIKERTDNLDQWSMIAIYALCLLPVIFYSLAQESMLEGQTIGKKILKIKVVKIDGYQASFMDYLTRWALRLVDIELVMGMVALITMSANKKQQRLGDIAAGTAVITTKNKINISHTILEELNEDYVPSFPQVIKLNDNDVRIIKERYNLAVKKYDHETIEKISNKIKSVTGIQYEGSVYHFIETVIKDYNYYTREM